MVMAELVQRLVPALFGANLLLLQLASSSLVVQGEWIGCPTVASRKYDVRLQGKDPVRSFTEISGLSISKTHAVVNDTIATTTTNTTGDPILYALTDGDNNNDMDGVGGRVGVFNGQTGDRLVTLVLPNATGESWDWETMTMGTCGGATLGFDANETCLYVGDVGDNVAIHTNGQRNDRKDTWPYRIIKFREPNLTKALENMTIDEIDIPESDIWILPFDYSHNSSNKPYADCEAIFLDHTGWGEEEEGNSPGDLYIITKHEKRRLRHNRLFRIPVEAWSRPSVDNPWADQYPSSVLVDVEKRQGQPQQLRTRQSSHTSLSIAVTTPNSRVEDTETQGVTYLPMYQPEVVGEYPHEEEKDDDEVEIEMPQFNSYQWTGADMPLDGTVISLTTKNSTAFFLRCPGESVANAITGGVAAPCNVIGTVNPTNKNGMETSAWAPDGMTYLQVPEGIKPRMGWADMDRSAKVNISIAKECPSHPHFDPSHPHFDNFWWDR